MKITYKRLWNKLTRLQKFLIFLVFAFLIFVVVVWKIEDVIEANLVDVAETSKSYEYKGISHIRQFATLNAFLHSWEGYKKYAWGHDTIKPVSREHEDWFGIGLTIIDSLDTIYLMNLKTEFEIAKKWIENELNFDKDQFVNVFEITIRGLGGLLSAYHLSGEKIFLTKANDLGRRLLPAFKTPTGIPFPQVNLRSGSTSENDGTQMSLIAEIGSIQLEFRDLSRCTRNPVYEKLVEKVNKFINKQPKNDGLTPVLVNPMLGEFSGVITFGGHGDSYYEYLLKQWLQTGKKENDSLITDYKSAIQGLLNTMVRKTSKNLTYIGELGFDTILKPKMDHLACFLPGTLLLGYKNGMPESHLKLANELLTTCYQMYSKQKTFLAPEAVFFNENMSVNPQNAYNHLRPELIESLYYFWVITGNKTYQNMGWKIFNAFGRFAKVKHGYSSIANVQSEINPGTLDKTESFWFAETLKYFYLLFSEKRNEIDLDKNVFNTEAHLLPIRRN